MNISTINYNYITSAEQSINLNFQEAAIWNESLDPAQGDGDHTNYLMRHQEYLEKQQKGPQSKEFLIKHERYLENHQKYLTAREKHLQKKYLDEYLYGPHFQEGQKGSILRKGGRYPAIYHNGKWVTLDEFNAKKLPEAT